MADNVDKLLKGRILVKEISPSSLRRTWIEVALHEEDLAAHPFRTPPYSMTSISPYRERASEASRFKVRTSSFDAEEIQQGYDPTYEDVGEYRILDSLQDLLFYLSSKGATLDDFVESSQTEYPL